MQPKKIESKSLNGGSQGASTTMPGRSVELDIEKELEELHRSPEWRGGVARKVLIRYPDLQIVLRAMKANIRIPEHHNPGTLPVRECGVTIELHSHSGIPGDKRPATVQP